MSSSCEHESAFGRCPTSALKRHAEIVLREIHQRGGRSRFVPVAVLEEALGLEQDLILHFCRTKLLGEVLAADRLTEELEKSLGLHSPLERQWIRDCFSLPHVRIRPPVVRLTESGLLKKRKRSKGRRKK